MSNVPDAFDKFHDKIALPKRSEERIESAWKRLHEHVTSHCEVGDDEVFLQGSYANDTAVRPVDGGAYDVDSCAAIISDAGASADEAFDYLEGVLMEDEWYAKRLDTDRERCVRIEYADDDQGEFHVDIVAARRAQDGALEIPIRSGGWSTTNPEGFTAWCDGRPEMFHRVVRMLKRWRDNSDEGSKRGVKSIVLQVLVARSLPDDASDDALAVTQTLQSIAAEVGGRSLDEMEVLNPSLEGEDLTETWDEDDFELFKGDVEKGAQLASQALNALTTKESHDLWRTLFGDDFPAAPDDTDDKAAARGGPLVNVQGRLPEQEAPADERYG